MPVPTPDRIEEYARKAVELVFRAIGLAPEQNAARRLVAGADLPRPTEGSKRVLIVSPRDWAAHVQYESVIGHALRLRGADVHFLTCGGELEICDRSNTYEAPPMPCTSCSRYTTTSLEAHGFALHKIRDGWTEHTSSWPELDALPMSALGSVVDDGLSLGEIVDIPLRWFLCAANVAEDPLGGVTARAFLRSARRIAAGITRALDTVQPETMLLLNGLFLFEGIAWALAKQRGIDVVTYERAFRKETLVFSRDVPAGFYDFGGDWDPERPLTAAEAEELDAYLARRRGGAAFDQYWRFQEHEENGRGGRLVVLFTNLTWDTAVIGRDDGFEDIRTWLDFVVAQFMVRPEDRLVIRIHPSEVRLPGKRTRDALGDHLARSFPDLPSNIEIVGPNDLRNSYGLMDACDVGLVYSSTAGLELALAGKPVIVGAQVHYRGKGFTIDVSSREDLARAVQECLEGTTPAVDVERARRYAHFFFFRAPIAAPGVKEPLPGLARLTIGDLADLAPGMNRDLDRLCAGILSGGSFVAKD